MRKRTKAPLKLHPEFLRKNGRKEFVVLPYDEFVAIRKQLEDAEDLFRLRQAVADDLGGPGLTPTQLKGRLGLNKTARKKTTRRNGAAK